MIIIDRITLPGSGFGTETIRHFGHENGNCVSRRFITLVAGWILKGKNGIHSLWNPTRGTRGRRLCDDRITLPG